MTHRFVRAITLLSMSAACTAADPAPTPSEQVAEPAIPAAAQVYVPDAVEADPLEVNLLPQAVIAGDQAGPRVRAADGSSVDPLVVRPAADPQPPQRDPLVQGDTPTDSATNYQTGVVVAEVLLALDDDAVFVDAPEAGGQVTVRDADGAPLADVVVTGALSAPGADAEAGCTTGADGTCLLVFAVGEGAFETGGAATVTAEAGGIEDAASLTVYAAPDALAIDAPGVGVQLPISPRYEGEVFDAPVYIHTLYGDAAAYDIELFFDATRLEVVDVLPGACPGFGAPVHNGHANANTTGRLLMNAINSSGAGCHDGDPEEVAVIRFAVRQNAAGDALETAPVSGTLRDLFDSDFSQLADNKPIALGDPFGTTTDGADVLVR